MKNINQIHWLVYTQRNTPTHPQYTGTFPQLWFTTGVTLESTSHCVVYKTTTNGFLLQIVAWNSLNLIEAIVEISRDATCEDAYCRRFTHSMICAGTPAGNKGPCYVRCLKC